LTESENTKRLLCKKNLSTTAIGEMVMSINQLNRGNIYMLPCLRGHYWWMFNLCYTASTDWIFCFQTSNLWHT